MSKDGPADSRVTPPVVVIGLGVLVALFVLAIGLQTLLVVLLFCSCLVPIGVAVYRGTFDLFEPIVFYSVFMFKIAVVIVDRLYLQEPSLAYPNVVSMNPSTAFLLVSALYLVFFAFVLVGYYLDVTRWVEVPTFYPPGVEHSVSLLRSVGLAYVAMGGVFYLLLIYTALDGNLLWLYTTTEPRNEIFGDSQLLLLGARMLYVGYAVWLVSILVGEKRVRARHLLPAGAVAAAFVLLGNRSVALVIVLVVTILLYYTFVYDIVGTRRHRIRFVRDRIHSCLKLSALPVAGVLLGAGTVVTRALRQDRGLQGAVEDLHLVELLTFGIHNRIPDNLLATIEVVPEEFGHYWGTLTLRVPLNYVPRSVWPEKPVLTTGAELRQVILPDQSGGRPPGQIGEFYIDGGYPAILLGAVLTGVVLRYVYELLGKNGRSPLFLLLYAFLLAGLVPEGLTNNGLWELSNHLLLFLPVVALDWLARNGYLPGSD